jgi:hypothetical protein
MKSLTAALLLALVALPTHTPASSQVLNNMSGKTNVHNPTSRAALTQNACVKANAGAASWITQEFGLSRLHGRNSDRTSLPRLESRKD